MSKIDKITNGIVIKKDGLYHHFWDDGQKIIKTDSLFRWLRLPLYLDDGITFEDFFKHVVNEHEIVSIIFESHLGGHSLSNWLEEWNRPNPGDTKDSDHQHIDYIEFSWVAEYHEKNPEYGIAEWVDFRGFGRFKDSDAYGDDEWHESSFSFSFTPLNEYKHYTLKINESWKLFNWDSKITSEMTEKEQDAGYTFSGTKPMTVYDVIGGILYDISFYGTPSSRQETSDEMESRVKRIEDGIEKTTTIENFDEFLENLGNHK